MDWRYIPLLLSVDAISHIDKAIAQNVKPLVSVENYEKSVCQSTKLVYENMIEHNFQIGDITHYTSTRILLFKHWNIHCLYIILIGNHVLAPFLRPKWVKVMEVPRASVKMEIDGRVSVSGGGGGGGCFEKIGQELSGMKLWILGTFISYRTRSSPCQTVFHGWVVVVLLKRWSHLKHRWVPSECQFFINVAYTVLKCHIPRSHIYVTVNDEVISRCHICGLWSTAGHVNWFW